MALLLSVRSIYSQHARICACHRVVETALRTSLHVTYGSRRIQPIVYIVQDGSVTKGRFQRGWNGVAWRGVVLKVFGY